jgi:phosphoglycolate phosphatase-like HAD superfamily hydrolase
MQKTLFAWDLNGTLETGSERADAEAINGLFEELGIARRVTEEEMRIAPLTWTDRINMFAADAEASNENIDRVVRLREELSVRYVEAFPGAIYALRKVKRKGDDNIVVSLIGKEIIENTLSEIGIKRYVDAAYSARDEFFAIRRNKGKYRELLKRLAAHKAALIEKHAQGRGYGRTIMVGDQPEDIAAGQLCGATTFFIGNGKADYSVKGPLDVVGIVYANPADMKKN